MMNARENALALLNKGTPERIGLYDSLWWELQQDWRIQGYLVKEDTETGKSVDVTPEEWFGYDLISVGGWTDNMPVRGYEEVLEETEDWKITKNGAGAIFKWWKKKSGTPEHIDFTMTSREVWEEKYRSLLLKTDDLRLGLDNAKPLFEQWKDGDRATTIHNPFIWEAFRASAGDVSMFESFALDPEWIKDFNRVYTDYYKAHYNRLMEVCGAPDVAYIYEDLGYRNGLFCSPNTLWELYLPYYKELVDFFHERGVCVILHSCGGIEKALPMIIEAGFDALNPMEVKAGCDVLRFAEQYGDKLAFVGGMDVRIFESGDRELIKREVIRLTREMKAIGVRFFFGSDHSLSPNVKYEDYKYALEIYRDNMMY